MALAIASVFYWEDIFNGVLRGQLQLTDPSSDIYEQWKTPPVASYLNMYVYNYTNPEDVEKNGAKPVVKELGPYAYREDRLNFVLVRTDSEITYLQNYSYIYEQAMSCPTCSEDDVITFPNAGVLTIMNMTKNVGRLEHFGIDVFIMAETTLFYRLPVKKMIWGYHDKFLALLAKGEGIIKPFVKDLPKINPDVKLRFNGSEAAATTGNQTIKTGKENLDDVQKITKWRGSSITPYWLGNYSVMINGTDGTRFGPNVNKEDKLYLFNTDLARSLYLIYENETKLFDINLYKFSTDAFLFANATTNPDNQGFCVPECGSGGILYVGHTQEGAPPIFVSSPHFYQGDPRLWEAIEGWSPPNKQDHGTSVSVEPITGILMEGHKRLQINTMVEKTGYTFTAQMTEKARDGKILLPMLWVHESAKIDKENAEKFTTMVYGGRALLKNTPYVLFGVAGFFLLICLFTLGMKLREQNVLNRYKEFYNAHSHKEESDKSEKNGSIAHIYDD